MAATTRYGGSNRMNIFLTTGWPLKPLAHILTIKANNVIILYTHYPYDIL